jgi:hypothetical protein
MVIWLLYVINLNHDIHNWVFGFAGPSCLLTLTREPKLHQKRKGCLAFTPKFLGSWRKWRTLNGPFKEEPQFVPAGTIYIYLLWLLLPWHLLNCW